MPREVLYPFHYTDGTIVPTNDWLCIPQQAIMQDQGYYNDPSRFKGFRFVRQENDNGTGTHHAKTQFSTPSFDFPFRGGITRPWYVLSISRSIWMMSLSLVRITSPGRFYVSIVAKMVLSALAFYHGL